VRLDRKRVPTIAGPAVGILLGAPMMSPLVDRNLSPVTSGVMIGTAGVICALSLGFGFWNAQRGEGRRGAKEKIWINC
jgi:hypothetical protein